MPPHLSDEELAALSALSPAALLRASDHLAACPDCRERRRALVRPEFAGGAAAFRDLTAAQSEDTDGVGTNDLGRLAELPVGRSEAADLQAFQEFLETHPAESFGRGETLPPSPVEETAEAAPRSWRWRLRQMVVPLAATALVALILIPLQRRGFQGEARAVATLRDGPLRIGETNVGLESLPADLQDAVRHAILHGLVPGTPASSLTRGGTNDPTPGTNPVPELSAFHLQSPPSGATVEPGRPTLRWTPFPGAVRQELILTSRLGGTAELPPAELSGALTEWTPPAPLVRGGIYRWRVRAIGADGQELARAPAGEGAGASFKILGDAAHDRLEMLRQHPTASRSHLALGVAYAREGLHAEAAAEFRALAEANPESTLARDLRRSADHLGE